MRTRKIEHGSNVFRARPHPIGMGRAICPALILHSSIILQVWLLYVGCRVACPNFWENVAEKSSPKSNVPAGIYLFKINNANIRTVSEICTKLPVTKPEWRHWSRSGIFIVNFEEISLIVLMFPLLTLNKEMQAGSALNKVFYGQKHRFSEMKIPNEF